MRTMRSCMAPFGLVKFYIIFFIPPPKGTCSPICARKRIRILLWKQRSFEGNLAGSLVGSLTGSFVGSLVGSLVSSLIGSLAGWIKTTRELVLCKNTGQKIHPHIAAPPAGVAAVRLPFVAPPSG
ncbi:hypothetical protein POVWA1_039290 [Plasmodium ovale wallikeri]|uniref:PIR Superfamily Protein n=1 Tax=Plasmodium ovale wallikeri TaxID=864142 RepID=A0A1A8Z5A5_PLAOA|nr:hypothetical protein POVWA1_039290 [Plasmodium ovale wallikeri]